MIFFSKRERIRREAANWVARLGGGADESEHTAFRAWYAADDRHAEAYDRMAAIWSASGRLPPSSVAEVEANRPGRRHPAFAYALAASLIVLAAAAFLLTRGSQPVEPGASAITYATARGELREVSLPDGSRLLLDAGSRIELRFTGAERRLLLREGRARFTVAHEPRPFIVEAGLSQVVATGTVFDVSLLGDRLAVVLLEGSVEVRRARANGPAEVRRLTAGNRIVVEREREPVVGRAGRGDLAWPRRMLEFDDVPLGEAVDIANRYSRSQIRIADDEVRRLRVTGAYRAGDVAGLARSLAAAFDLHVETGAAGNMTLSARRPTP